MLKRILLLTLPPAITFAEELPTPVKAIEKQDITVTKTFNALGGVRGYLGKYQSVSITICLTPDSRHAISSYIYSERGENPSNTLTKGEICIPAGREVWQRMEQSRWLFDDKKDTPVVVYIFANPFFPYCKQFQQQVRPWASFGKVQLRVLLVGVAKPESPVATMTILVFKDLTGTWQWYEASGGRLKLNVLININTEQVKVLSNNEKLVDDLGVNVTSTIYYMSKGNTLQ